MNNTSPKVSVILPNYDHAPFLRVRLDSIFDQTYQNVEVIILDDCSKDHSLELLEPYNNHPKVAHFIVNSKNSGSPFRQWQKGLELATGDYIWIAESDDFCDLDFLEKHIKQLQTADVSVSKTMTFVGNKQGREIVHPIFDDVKRKESILYCPILNVSCVIFKSYLVKDLINQHYTDYKIIGDRVFYFEKFRNANIVLNRETTSYFRQSESNISKLDNRPLKYYENYLKEHFNFIDYACKVDSISVRTHRKKYLTKFFNRVRDRVPKKQKWTLSYFHLFLSYKMALLKY